MKYYILSLTLTAGLYASEAMRLERVTQPNKTLDVPQLLMLSYGAYNQAVRTNNTAYLRRLIQLGIPLMADKASELLVSACTLGHRETAEMLLKKCLADINYQHGAPLKELSHFPIEMLLKQ